MTLELTKYVIYADPYRTNWHYLDNMTSLQVKALEEIHWDKYYRRIHTGLWSVPLIRIDENSTKNSVKGFIVDLNNEIKRL
jgi:hypothetical protein